VAGSRSSSPRSGSTAANSRWRLAADLPEWQALIEPNPKNRERILALDADEFERTMIRWLNAFVPKPGQTIPGVDDDMFHNIKVPTLIIRAAPRTSTTRSAPPWRSAVSSRGRS
jgi:pimeloyl-ACP methyl ester carboxylesterase